MKIWLSLVAASVICLALCSPAKGTEVISRHIVKRTTVERTTVPRLVLPRVAVVPRVALLPRVVPVRPVIVLPPFWQRIYVPYTRAVEVDVAISKTRRGPHGTKHKSAHYSRR